MANTLSHLKLSPKAPQRTAAKPKSAPVAESWDDGLSSGSDTETENSDLTSSLSRSSTKERDSLSPISTANSADPPNPPPPTPASPTPFDFPDSVPYGAGGGLGSGTHSRGGSGTHSPARRPDKTTAVAGRLIAGALGVRAPKRSEEEREYDKAMREKERKRKEEERKKEQKEKQAAEERKRAVWED